MVQCGHGIRFSNFVVVPKYRYHQAERAISMPIVKSVSDILPALAKGKALQAVHVYQDEGSLNVDVRLQGGLALELTFSVAFQSTATLTHWESGNSHVVESAKL
jgi:hypothetical protein